MIELEKDIGADVTVMATQGNRGFFRMVLGCAAERTVREVRGTVVTIRSPDWD